MTPNGKPKISKDMIGASMNISMIARYISHKGRRMVLKKLLPPKNYLK
jgi:hypothetical protein